jgi:hypothetical protein
MRLPGLVALLACGAASAAHAGVLTSASWVESVHGVPIAVPVLASGLSTATSVSVSLEIPEFHFETFQAPLATGTARLRLTVHGSAQISAGPSMAVATMGVFEPDLSEGAVLGLVPPPAEPWRGGRRHPFFTVGGFPATARAVSYGWTLGAVTFTGLTYFGYYAWPDAKAEGRFDLDAFGAGTVTLIAPRRVVVDAANAIGLRTLGSFTTLTLHFVPEPDAALLLAGAAGALVLRARRQDKSPLRQRPEA